MTSTALLVMGAGYYGFGSDVPDYVLNGFTQQADPRFPILGGVAAIAICVNILVGVPVFVFCIARAFESSGPDRLSTALTLPNALCRAGLTLALTVASYAVPYVCEIIALVSAVFVTFNTVVCPVFFFHMARRRAKACVPDNGGRSPVGVATLAWHVCILLL